METDATSVPILFTKLYRPQVPRDHVFRSELLERLEGTPHRPLVLVSAPAGYGKSTLVSAWLERGERPSAWLSLDENDNNLRQFLAYVIAAVQTVFSEALRDLKSMIHAPDLPPIPVLAATLVNEIEQIDQSFIIVLDDIHRITKKSVYDFLKLILRHPPRSMQLVLVGRRDPVLPIAALRARDMLTELRMGDLRFTIDEAATFMQSAMGHDIEESLAAALVQKTEGWVTGLRLLVLAIRGQEDPGRILLRLKGTTRYVVDYLISEVLDHQPAPIRDFLLSTSILRRFCAPLCDALNETGETPVDSQKNGQALIRWLLEFNLFVIPLDSENQWFRYHHMFEELMRQQLQRKRSPGAITALHRRASRWFAANGLISEAIDHAIEAGDTVDAVKIIAKNRLTALNKDKWFVLEQWLSKIPDEIRQNSVELLLAKAWVLNHRFRLTEIPEVIEWIESIARKGEADTALMGELNFFKAFLLFWQGQVESSVEISGRAQGQIPKDDRFDLMRGDNEIYHAMALQMSGKGYAAIMALNEKIDRNPKRKGMYITRLISAPCFVHLLSGDLVLAESAALRLKQVSIKSGLSYASSWSEYMQACCCFYTNELSRARHHFEAALKHKYIMHASQAINCLAGLAMTYQALERANDANAIIAELTAFTLEMNDPGGLLIARSARVRLALMQNRLEPGIEWVQSFYDPLQFASFFVWLELPHVTQCRVLIANGSEAYLVDACEKLEGILEVADAIHNTFHKIDLLALKALALYKLSRTRSAQESLKRAIKLAMPGGWVRPFVEPGPSMIPLLEQLRLQNVAVAYVDKLLAAQKPYAAPSSRQAVASSVTSHRQAPGPASFSEPLVEQLTHRELDVLELLSKRLQNKEIAECLSISSITVKSHLKNIYQKLQVHRRREAVAKAAMLGIIPGK